MTISSSLVKFSSLNATIPVVLNAFLKILRFLIFDLRLSISLFNSSCLAKKYLFCSIRVSTLVL